MKARVVAAGDSAFAIELADRIDPAVNERALQIAEGVRGADLPVTDIVVGYRTVTVFVDPLARPFDEIKEALERVASSPGEAAIVAHRRVEVPVCYEGALAPDLEDVASFAFCSVEDVIARHLAGTYRVYMVGFVPGFAYMAPVDPVIAAPRRATPRLRVPAGSVAVAAGQTGIYPAETPGGWNVIGRCPIRPYDPDRAKPFLFHPGDVVRFHRISEAEYAARSEWGTG